MVRIKSIRGIGATRPVCLILLASSFLLCRCSSPDKPAESDWKAGEAVYKKDCAGCHGPQLKGGVGANLVADTLKHGSGKDSISATISNGVLGTVMQPWKGTLKDEEISSLTDYILYVRKNPSVVKSEELPSHVKTKAWGDRVHLRAFPELCDAPPVELA